jgi:hypothetical protein
LRTLAHDHPDRFFACLALLDAPPREAGARDQGAEAAPPGTADGTADAFPEAGPSRRLKDLTVREDRLLTFLGEGRGLVHQAPPDARVVACTADTSRREVRLVLRSVTFPEVPDGEPIPALEAHFVSPL